MLPLQANRQETADCMQEEGGRIPYGEREEAGRLLPGPSQEDPYLGGAWCTCQGPTPPGPALSPSLGSGWPGSVPGLRPPLLQKTEGQAGAMTDRLPPGATPCWPHRALLRLLFPRLRDVRFPTLSLLLAPALRRPQLPRGPAGPFMSEATRPFHPLTSLYTVIYCH